MELILEDINSKIYTIRGVQVMLDRDLAKLYQVENRVLKQAVKRNINRFPSDFMFVLNEKEIDLMVSQFVIPSKKHLGGAKPYVFTEQGVASLSSILNSQIAIEINIAILRAFVKMRKFLLDNASIFQRFSQIEQKLLTHEDNFEKIFKAIEQKQIKQTQGIFYDGQIYDSYSFISDLLRSAKDEMILIDNYIDDSVLTLFSKIPNIKVTIYTNTISKQLKLDFEKYSKQYDNITLKTFQNSHDRFLIIDKKEIFHIGASIKDLGKKWFAFSKINLDIDELIKKLK
ncbi:MAG: ORF6N domain-containing protein [Aliarcobacter sp.]|nr:ORF6N domain-containing protein [Aliarcobacter sp.]